MARLDGLPKGKPLRIPSKTYFENTLKNSNSYYVIKIKVKDVNINRDFPLIATKDENGSRNFTNTPDEDTILTIDKITLEDYIKFHKIKYEFIEGVYFPDGFNSKINEVIKELFEERLKLKKEKKPTSRSN